MAINKTRLLLIGILLISSIYFMVSCAARCGEDTDGDGYGTPASPECTYPELDCDDGNPDVYPGAEELCDGIDNQCAGDPGYGEVDEGCGKLVFITESIHTANLGGPSGADAICQGEADAAGIVGTYKAWLSDSETYPDISFERSLYPYYLVNGTIIANDYDDLVDSQIRSGIEVTAAGDTITDSFETWTNTASDGTPQSTADETSCAGFSTDNNSYESSIGDGRYFFSIWTYVGTAGCDTVKRIYCFQQ